MTAIAMCLATAAGVAVLAAAAAPNGTAASPRPRALRVCADPNNMPFSDSTGHGFENRIARLVANDLHEPVQYTWWAQRRGFVRNTLGAERCDVVIGIIAGDEQLATTAPYYRSTYVFVTRRSSRLHFVSMNDPRLHHVRIGIHVIGDDYNSLPPGVALAGRGIVRNVIGYSIYGNYATASPPSTLISAVAQGKVDVAIAWGPLAGYYAARSHVPLDVSPVTDAMAGHGIPFSYAIAMGVRKGDTTRLGVLQRELDRRHAAIQRILREYDVPLGGEGGAGTQARADSEPSAGAIVPHTASGGTRP
ncbi:MAG TPA: substrate-binding domain-containing protein [Gemmatimonadaceae bacterium]